jgi:hypothetical protein
MMAAATSAPAVAAGRLTGPAAARSKAMLMGALEQALAGTPAAAPGPVLEQEPEPVAEREPKEASASMPMETWCEIHVLIGGILDRAGPVDEVMPARLALETPAEMPVVIRTADRRARPGRPDPRVIHPAAAADRLVGPAAAAPVGAAAEALVGAVAEARVEARAGAAAAATRPALRF